jgi:hypothetical protein
VIHVSGKGLEKIYPLLHQGSREVGRELFRNKGILKMQ